MKTPRDFAENYLYFILGGRKGLDIREIVQDKELEESIIEELAAAIEERDKEIYNECRGYYR